MYTLGKYGLAQFVTYLPFYKKLSGRFRKSRKIPELFNFSLGEKLRHVAVELGPTLKMMGLGFCILHRRLTLAQD